MKYGVNYEVKGGRSSGNYVLLPILNGEIALSVHLARSLHYFAGGSPYDISLLYGVSYQNVLSSV